MKFTRNPNISQIVLLFCALLVVSCQERDEPKRAQTASFPLTEKSTLEKEIAKMIQQESYDAARLKSSLKGMTWAEVYPIILATKEALQKETGQQPDKKGVVKTMLKIQTVIDGLEIEASKVRQKETLRKITKELQEMAEEEGLLSQ